MSERTPGQVAKRIKDQVSMRGLIAEITVTDFRCSPGDFLDQVELGKTFVIKRNGKDIAVLSKVPGIQLTMTVDCLGQVEYDL